VNKRLNFGGDPDHRLDTGIVFLDSSRLGDTERGINRLRWATLQCRACTSRHRHSNYDVITSPARDRQPRQPVMVNDIARLVKSCLGGGMHCLSASSFSLLLCSIFCYFTYAFLRTVSCFNVMCRRFIRSCLFRAVLLEYLFYPSTPLQTNK